MGKQETLKRKEIRVTEKKVNGKVILALISGAIATGVMSIVMELETFIGLPEINTAAMLSEIMSTTLAVGWVVHFAVGIFFSYAYILLINSRLPIKNSILRGITYGLLVFVFAQIMIMIIGTVGLMTPPSSDRLILVIIGSLLGHLVYGASLGILVNNNGKKNS